MLMQASLGGELWTILRDRGTHAQLERLRVCMHCCWSLEYTCAWELREHKRSWPGCEYKCALRRRYCKYACAVGQVVSTHAQLESLWVRKRSLRGYEYTCTVGEVACMHAQLEKLWVRMCSWKGCEYACAVEGVASTHAQAVASSHAQLNGLRVCMHSWRGCECAAQLDIY